MNEQASSKTPPASAWTLHPQLERDTAPVGDLKLCRVVAINDAYPWLILVPRRIGATEIVDLGDEAAALMTEIAQCSGVLRQVTRCDKLNVAAIGNVVPQLHIHIVARQRTDPLWPKPIWGMGPVQPGDAQAFARLIAAVRQGLELAG